MRASKTRKSAKPVQAKTPSRSVKKPKAAKRRPAIQSDSKQASIIAMLREPSGTTVAAVMKATDWQAHSVRGFFTSVVRKKLSLNLQSSKVEGNRVYRIVEPKKTARKNQTVTS